MTLRAFYKGRRVLVTGHTGFKGSWLCHLLKGMGAEVAGYALTPPTEPNLFTLAGVGAGMEDLRGDVRDLGRLQDAFARFQPEVVFHLAAQPLVRASYREPVYTYETNVLGTVHALECARTFDCVRSFVNVTTDKVYRNLERTKGYGETDELNGFDPYSNSKSCSELVTACYRNSFFADGRAAVSTVRAGNVIGGGDFARDRILPDCLRAAERGEPILVRNPHSVRPYQHVLEPLFAYLFVAMRQMENGALSGAYNVGPKSCDMVETGVLVDCFCGAWGKGASWVARPEAGPHEAGLLTLNCDRIRDTLGWTPRWNVETAVAQTVAWHKAYLAKEDVRDIMNRQIEAYENP